MFKQRFLTAILLIPLVWLAIYYAQGPILLAIIGLIVAAMAWEWTALIPLISNLEKGLFFLGLVITVGLLYPVFAFGFIGNIVLWLAVFAIVVTYPKTRSKWNYPGLLVPMAWICLGFFALSLWYLFQQNAGRALLVYLLGLVWATDTGAYVFGKLWGKHRLIPQVSPGKTLEGVGGGMVFGSAVALVGLAYFQPGSVFLWLMQAWILIGIAMLGDLWISVLKRRVQLKDTGHLLPGHGGILDRLDSLLACLPLFYYFSMNY